MKKPLQYLVSVILTLLLTFSLIGTVAVLLVGGKALNPKTCTNLIVTQNLAEKVHTSLHATFTQQENTTGIPVTVYEHAIAQDQLAVMISDSIENAFSYLEGEAENIGITPDFTVLEADLTEFFTSYATENGFAQDETFDQALSDSIAAAEQMIQTNADVFRFASLADAGLMAKVRRVMPWITRGTVVAIVATVALVFLLLLMHRRDMRQALYWIANALCSASLLMLLPTAWIHVTRWFDRFTVKSDQTFAAVTGYLYGLTGTVIVIAIIGFVLAIALWVLFGVLRRSQHSAEPAST